MDAAEACGAGGMTTLPDWLTVNEKGIFVVDPDIAYPALLQELGAPNTPSKVDQYWIEVVFQCAKLEVQRIVGRTELDPRPAKPLEIRILGHGGRDTRWRLEGKPEGKGWQAATFGKEARAHYIKLRGSIPA